MLPHVHRWLLPTSRKLHGDFVAPQATPPTNRVGPQVEILLPELFDPLSGPVYAEEGDQQRFWKLTRRFLDNLAASMPGKRIRAVRRGVGTSAACLHLARMLLASACLSFPGQVVLCLPSRLVVMGVQAVNRISPAFPFLPQVYPDAGVSAMLKNQWADAAFNFASLNDRRPVADDDDIVVLAAPDPPGADDAIHISQRAPAGWRVGARASLRCGRAATVLVITECLLRRSSRQLHDRFSWWYWVSALPQRCCSTVILPSRLPSSRPVLFAGLAEGQRLVMFNPRLASGDVGVGLSVRRMRESFLSRFTTTYSLRPIQDVGSVFRRYPGTWQVRRRRARCAEATKNQQPLLR
jgi:hypothetical protein